MKLIVGLGNPGEKYARNRHNIGFMAIDEIARGYSFGSWKKRFQGLAAEGQIGTEKCILLKPMTYMNESGRSTGEAMRFYKLSPSDVIVIHDELDLKLGAVRVKTGGGNAGHNGLKSISAYIGNDYVRVRLGIGHPGDKALVIHYVLQDFAKSDKQWLEPFLDGIARGMARLVEGGEATFLSEAARGLAAVKLNGASAPSAAKLSKAAPKIEATPTVTTDAVAADAAAESRPELTRVAAIQVVAARGGTGGGAVSTAVMLPEPVRPAPAEPAAQVEHAPQFTPPPHSATAPLKVAPEQQAETAGQQGAPQPAATAKQEAAAEPKKGGGIFGWWFRKRIRGGSGQ